MMVNPIGLTEGSGVATIGDSLAIEWLHFTILPASGGNLGQDSLVQPGRNKCPVELPPYLVTPSPQQLSRNFRPDTLMPNLVGSRLI